MAMHPDGPHELHTRDSFPRVVIDCCDLSHKFSLLVCSQSAQFLKSSTLPSNRLLKMQQFYLSTLCPPKSSLFVIPFVFFNLVIVTCSDLDSREERTFTRKRPR